MTILIPDSDLCELAPSSRQDICGWVEVALGVEMPLEPRCPDHATPLDYVAHSFLEQEGDALVWAGRGGGKTFAGAIVTLLDLIFKPGIQVRILGGSLEQSQKMYDYLRGFLARPALAGRLRRGAMRRGLALRNGSEVEVLAQSERSVRGHHVQKVRCDEVELFDRPIWEAAQFIPKSRLCGTVPVRGTLEALSTMHRSFGLMRELVEKSKVEGRKSKVKTLGTTFDLQPSTFDSPAHGFRLFKWCAMDVMKQCGPALSCGSCKLATVCEGKAKGFTGGFLSVPDVLSIRQRTSARRFDAEMLCRAASRESRVFGEFDPATHVREVQPDESLEWVGGMDFGMQSPTVMLWAQVRRLEACGSRLEGSDPCLKPLRPLFRVEIIDELVARDTTLPRFMGLMRARGWPMPRWLGVDPAGHQRQSQTGMSTIDVLRRDGYRVRSRRMPRTEGLDIVRRYLECEMRLEACDLRLAGSDSDLKPRAASLKPLLLIHPRCRQLIEAMTEYHFDPDRPYSDDPVKDGPDHLCDALRYMVGSLTFQPAQCHDYLTGRRLV